MILALKWMKEDRKGGRKGKEYRKFGEGLAGDSWEEHEHKDKITGNQIFIQNILTFLSNRFPFKGEGDRSLRIKRRVADGAAVVAVSSSPRKLISGFFFDGITTGVNTWNISYFSVVFFGSVDVVTVVVFHR